MKNNIINEELILIFDTLVFDEFNEDFDIYSFEKKALFKIFKEDSNGLIKGRKFVLNQFGITIDVIPGYIIAITSIINVIIRFRRKPA